MTHIRKTKIIFLIAIALAFGVISGGSVAGDQPQYSTKIIGATKKNFNSGSSVTARPVLNVPSTNQERDIAPAFLKEIISLKEVAPDSEENLIEFGTVKPILIGGDDPVEVDEPILEQEPITELKIEEPIVTLPEVKLEVKEEAEPDNVEELTLGPQSLDLMEEKPTDMSSYIIGSGDTVKVTVFAEKNLSGDYKVADDGTIAMPLIGAINLKNKKLRDAEEIIELAYKDGYLKDPSVSIEVQESRPFFILGEVRRPGSYNYMANMNILQAVAISGGFTYRANRKSVDILRGDVKKPTSMSVNTKSVIQAGDIIFVRERFF